MVCTHPQSMLRALQKKRVKEMFAHPEAPLKILILDKTTQGLLSPLLRVSDLRECGVTCHFLIDSRRDPIRDAPAFYFLAHPEPLVSEMEQDLYAGYFLNSSSTFTRSKLESVAVRASEKQVANKVKSVIDQFLHFVSLQEDLFSLCIPNSFACPDDPEVSKQAALGLLSVAVTLGEMPYILSDGSAVAKMLDQRLRTTKLIKGGVKRSLFVILNRDFDVFTPLRHVMSYAELIHDVLGIFSNKVVVDGEHSYEIDADSEFFKTNAYLDFPVVAEVVEKELSEYKKEMALRCVDDRSGASEIQKALESAPHLQKKNEVISSNLNICMHILKSIKDRGLDDFYHMEENMDREQLMALSDRGTDEDILRLGLVMLTGKHADLVEPLFARRKIDASNMIEFFKGKVRQSGLKEKLSNLLFRKGLPITTVVEDALASVKSQSYRSFSTHDPSGRGLFISEVSRIVVYVHGGGTYSEMKALKELESTHKIPITFGGSEILRASEFLKQVRERISK